MGVSESVLKSDFAEVYPNPASGVLFINIQRNSQANYHAQIMDLLGTVVMEENLNDQNQIDISKISPGLYLLKMLKNGRCIESRKLVIR